MAEGRCKRVGPAEHHGMMSLHGDKSLRGLRQAGEKEALDVGAASPLFSPSLIPLKETCLTLKETSRLSEGMCVCHCTSCPVHPTHTHPHPQPMESLVP